MQFGLNMCDTTLQCEQNEEQKRKSDSSHNKKEKRISVSFAESFNIPDGRDCKSPLSKKYIFTFSYATCPKIIAKPKRCLMTLRSHYITIAICSESISFQQRTSPWLGVVVAYSNGFSLPKWCLLPNIVKFCFHILNNTKYLLLQWQEPRRSPVQAAGEPGPRGVPPRPLPRHPARLPRRGRWRWSCKRTIIEVFTIMEKALLALAFS